MPASVYSKKLQDLICERVAKGEKPSVAAEICGISDTTHFNWMARGEGEQGESPYREYVAAIKRAEAEAEAEWIAAIRSAALSTATVTKEKTVTKPNGVVEVTKSTEQRSQWQAAAWLLERTRDGYNKASVDEAITLIARAIAGGDERVTAVLLKKLQALGDPPTQP